MSERIVVVGSGASGVHFTLSLLRKGYHVTMLDVGHAGSEIPNPQDALNSLKKGLKDPVGYFLGDQFQAVIYPDFEAEYYGFPPSKEYVFEDLSTSSIRAMGFSPLVSFAQGGLAEAWTGGAYPFNETDLKEFPFAYEDIEPHYEEVSSRIGITGIRDDLGELFPLQRTLMAPLALDEHSQVLLEEYAREKEFLKSKFGFFLGRSRSAVLSEDMGERKKCNYDGRCLWGCPLEALYTPSVTLKECMAYSKFTYLNDIYVSHFKLGSGKKVTSVVGRSLKRQETKEVEVDKLVLASGTLCSSRIFLNSVFIDSGQIVELKGLMDNRQILVPFVNLRMIGKRYNPETYQYHQIAVSLKGKDAQRDVHGLITTLKTALVHPIIQNIPFDLKTSMFIFRNVHSALGLLNVNFPDTRRACNYVTLQQDGRSDLPSLVIHYSPEREEKGRIKGAMKAFKKALRKLGCVVPPGMAHARPMGASVHYAGTIPMVRKKAPFTVSEYGQSHDFDNLFIVDGATFPSLPAKNLTFTLMANAVRVAEAAF